MKVRPILMGLAAGAAVYAGSAGLFSFQSKTALIGGDIVVSPSLSPVLSPRGQVTRGDKTGDKHVVTSVSPSLSPVSPALSPRISSVSTPTPSFSPTPSPIATPYVTPRVSTPTPTPSSTSTPAPTPSQTPQPTPTPTETPSATPLPVATLMVVINEIAWAGTSANAADEWVELYNSGADTVDLSGWALYEGDTRIINLSQSIAPGHYFLVERSDDMTVSDIPADVFGPFGGSGLRNSSGEYLQLRDALGVIVDSVDCSGGAWFGGSSTSKATMERIDASLPGNEPLNWSTNDGSVTTGLDAAGNPLIGTPKYRNSVAK
jgi:lamin tail-like protein